MPVAGFALIAGKIRRRIRRRQKKPRPLRMKNRDSRETGHSFTSSIAGDYCLFSLLRNKEFVRKA
jgi:hypothetical protein